MLYYIFHYVTVNVWWYGAVQMKKIEYIIFIHIYKIYISVGGFLILLK